MSKPEPMTIEARTTSTRGATAFERPLCGLVAPLAGQPQEALARHGKPEIFNTDRGSQFTSTDFTKVLKDAEIACTA